MAAADEDMNIIAGRIALLGAIVILGVTGNALAIYLNVKIFKKDPLNGLGYIHLGVTDFVLCCFYAPFDIILEWIRYFKLEETTRTWAPYLNFINREISQRITPASIFISITSLIFLAGIRVWKVFFPFRKPRPKILATAMVLADGVIIAASCFLIGTGSNFFETPLCSSGTQLMNSSSDWSVACNSSQIQNVTMLSEGEWDTNGEISNMSLDSGEQSAVWSRDLSGQLIKNFSDDAWKSEGFVQAGDVLKDNDTDTTNDPVVRGTETPYSFGFPVDVMKGIAWVSVSSILLAYIAISIRLKQSDKYLAQLNVLLKKQFIKRQIQHQITHAIICSILVICFLPSLLKGYWGITSKAVTRLTWTIAVANSALNPFVYCLMIKTQRMKLWKWLTCRTDN